MPGLARRPRTLYDKIFEEHVVYEDSGTVLLYIDRHMIHEVSSPQAFEGLKTAGRRVRKPECVLATTDHNTPTTSRRGFKNVSTFIKDEESRLQCETLEHNVKEHEILYYGLGDSRQGIVHVVGPEAGFTIPGATIVCGDSHTSTHGAFGALAFGIGTSEVEHVLATQTLQAKKSNNMKIQIDGSLPLGVSSKDVIMYVIGVIGTAGGVGFVIEFCGSTIRAMSMEERMTICNMSIEAGARAGLIAPDETTITYLENRPLAPKANKDPHEFNSALEHWRNLSSDDDASWDKEIYISAEDISPSVTWGTSPEDVVPITGVVPSPEDFTTEAKRQHCEQALKYMGLTPGTKMTNIPVDKVFVGSCTNSRIDDLRLVAHLVRGQKVAQGVHAMVVPGSGLVKRQAEKEGLHEMLIAAGFDWRESGCSMCVGLNEDVLRSGQRCASTTNRNFEGRQGAGGRTHLVSPAIAAATALAGHLADVSTIERYAKVKAELSKPAYTIQVTNEEPSNQEHAVHERHSDKGRVSEAKQDVPAQSSLRFTTLTGVAAPLRRSNVDTDVILPKQFCKTIKRSGLAKGLFFDWRFDENGKKRPDFILNQAPYDNAKILITKDNFGCGSSREHAPWALLDFGIRCIIAPSFGEIFYNNSFKNAMLPICIDEPATLEALLQQAEAGTELQIDLEQQVIRSKAGQQLAAFQVDGYRKHRLLNGIDEISVTLEREAEITEFETERSKHRPWLDGPCGDARLSQKLWPLAYHDDSVKHTLLSSHEW